MRKSFTTSIEEDIQDKFKEKCKTNSQKMNDVLEALMNAYIDGKVNVKASYTIDVGTEK